MNELLLSYASIYIKFTLVGNENIKKNRNLFNFFRKMSNTNIKNLTHNGYIIEKMEIRNKEK